MWMLIRRGALRQKNSKEQGTTGNGWCVEMGKVVGIKRRGYCVELLQRNSTSKGGIKSQIHPVYHFVLPPETSLSVCDINVYSRTLKTVVRVTSARNHIIQIIAPSRKRSPLGDRAWKQSCCYISGTPAVMPPSSGDPIDFVST